uniref:Uncharacterized protein n=1 Tax=Arion vulgaris TaxID=1028688 RepID=A0A0B6YSQ2_9EUPU
MMTLPDTKKNWIHSLLKMHKNNRYVQQFRMALDKNRIKDLKIVNKADKKSAQGYAHVFIAPVINEYPIVKLEISCRREILY